MIATIHTTTLFGVDAIPVKVEVNITRGLHRQITGLADQSVKECIDRLPDIINHLEFKMPKTRVTFHLSPAGIPKKGTSFDLPIIIALLVASDQLPENNITRLCMMAGEVTLDGTIKPVRGILCMAEKAKELGFKGLIIPQGNAREAALIEGINIYPAKHTREVIEFINSGKGINRYQPDSSLTTPVISSLDFKDIAGQQTLKRAMEIAATGGHHSILVGPPGCGKSSCSKRLPSILPPMSKEEILETTKIYSTLQNNVRYLMTERPFRVVHHTISDAGLIGGGLHATCGEITLAHNGILFMDEFSEFKAGILEALREPLEDRKITVARNKAIITYPAAFTLIAAMNPCLCGYFGHPTRKCTCSKRALFWFHRKISGPLLDRFDVQVNAEPVALSEIHTGRRNDIPAESSERIRERVIAARTIQQLRFKHSKGINSNAQMQEQDVAQYCSLGEQERRFLLDRLEKLQMSPRAYTAILKVSRTIADLAGKERIELSHIAESIHLRAFDHPVEKLLNHAKNYRHAV